GGRVAGEAGWGGVVPGAVLGWVAAVAEWGEGVAAWVAAVPEGGAWAVGAAPAVGAAASNNPAPHTECEQGLPPMRRALRFKRGHFRRRWAASSPRLRSS